ncbi:8571_t:CDS:2, partial [Dentiscutata erythropus]
VVGFWGVVDDQPWSRRRDLGWAVGVALWASGAAFFSPIDVIV